MLEADGCCMVLAVNADCGDRIYTFDLAYEESEETHRILVQSPETIAGISAIVDQTDIQLVFEDVVLDLGMHSEAMDTPLIAPYLLSQCIKNDYIAYTSDSDQGVVVRYYHGYDEERLEVQVVIDRASLIPKTCEVFQDGQVVLSAKIVEFELIDT